MYAYKSYIVYIWTVFYPDLKPYFYIAETVFWTYPNNCVRARLNLTKSKKMPVAGNPGAGIFEQAFWGGIFGAGIFPAVIINPIILYDIIFPETI